MFSFPPNAELTIRPSPPILMRWPCRLRPGSVRSLAEAEAAVAAAYQSWGRLAQEKKPSNSMAVLLPRPLFRSRFSRRQHPSPFRPGIGANVRSGFRRLASVWKFGTALEAAAEGLVRAPAPSWRTWGDEGLLPGGAITAVLATSDAVQRVTVAGVLPNEGNQDLMGYSPFPGGQSRGADLDARDDLCVQLRDDGPRASPRRKATSFAE